MPPDELGEGIGWVAEANELWRVDILAGVVHCVRDPLSDAPTDRLISFEGEVGFALPRRGGGLVVGAEQTIWLVESDGSRKALVTIDERSANRWNDAICDPNGRLWAGTFARDRRLGEATLYRIDPDGAIESVLPDLTISNGLDWVEPGSRLHFVDSPSQRVDVLDIDVATGRIGRRQPFAEISQEMGMPDGLCIDAEGGTWVALFGGARVVCYDPAGRLVEELHLPVPHPTNVCIGGPSGQEMFIATARHRLSPDERKAFPAAGQVLHANCDVAARPMFAFAG